jgi:hypothetical protein
MQVTCPPHFILIEFWNKILFIDEYKLWNSSWNILPQFPLFSLPLVQTFSSLAYFETSTLNFHTPPLPMRLIEIQTYTYSAAGRNYTFLCSQIAQGKIEYSDINDASILGISYFIRRRITTFKIMYIVMSTLFGWKQKIRFSTRNCNRRR